MTVRFKYHLLSQPSNINVDVVVTVTAENEDECLDIAEYYMRDRFSESAHYRLEDIENI